MTKWLTCMTVQKLVVVIKDVETNEVLERWQFDVQCDKNNVTSDGSDGEGYVQLLALLAGAPCMS